MGLLESLEVFKRNRGFGNSLIKVDIVDEDLIGGDIKVVVDNSEVLTGKIDKLGTKRFLVEDSGRCEVTARTQDGREVTEVFIIGAYGTYKCKLSMIEVYSMRISKIEKNPELKVSYVNESEGLEPARMDFEREAFKYGGFENAFFIPRPCLVESSGVVKSYLDINDYTKDLEGNNITITEEGRENVMVEMSTVWVRCRDCGDFYEVNLANKRITNEYVAPSFMREDGSVRDKIYWAVYESSKEDWKARSLSGKQILTWINSEEEVRYSKSNGIGWFVSSFIDRMLIQLILIMMAKTTDLSNAFGWGKTGVSLDSDKEELTETGLLDKKGLFFGTNNGLTGVKVLGIENLWGNSLERLAGCISDGCMIYINTKSDEETYKDDIRVYKAVTSVSGALGSVEGVFDFQDGQTIILEGIVPSCSGGSSSTDMCDLLSFKVGEHKAIIGSPYKEIRSGLMSIILTEPYLARFESVGSRLVLKL